ncbi:hypothetical protein KY331_01235 [Candidatus Woesearchaeota archaeon]|nr:hypothetical protein [Candidatus Woesearchaeota archaeon]
MAKIISDSSILKNKDLNFVDMHHHSTISDGDTKPEVLAKVYSKNKIGLCLADHNQIRGSIHLAKQKNLFSIPAIEITSKEAKDILAYFYNIKDLISFWEKEIKKRIWDNVGFNLNRTKIPAAEIPDKIKAYNGIPVLAHPFAMKPKNSYHFLSDKDFMKKIKGVELYTFEKIKSEQAQTIKNCNKPLTAGSDGHTSFSSDILTAADSFEIDDFLDSVLKRKHIIYYNKFTALNILIQKGVIIKNNIHITTPNNE